MSQADGTGYEPAEVAKWKFLADAPINDARHPLIRLRAQGLWVAAGGEPLTFAHLALALARDGIVMTRDTSQFGGEDIAGLTRAPTEHDAIDAIERGQDDCDAKARLFVALCLARGLPAQMMPLWQAGQLAHVYARVWVNGVPLDAETTLARARLGDNPAAQGQRAVPVETETGKWRLSGH